MPTTRIHIAQIKHRGQDRIALFFDYDSALIEKVKRLKGRRWSASRRCTVPMGIKKLQPLVALHHILQHVLPAYFQKCRYYGLHAPACAKKIATELPQSISNNGKTIRTLMQIIKAIIGIEGFPCKECGSVEWEEEEELRKDKKWLEAFLVIPSSRGDPERTPYMKPNKDFSLFEKPLPYARNNKKGQKLQAFPHQQRG